MNHADLNQRIKKTFDVFGKFFTNTDYRYRVHVDKSRAGMPKMDLFPLEKLMDLREQGGRSQIGMSITFSGFKLGTGIKETKVVMALRFMPEEVELYWYTSKESDTFAYSDKVTDAAMPVMKKVAEDVFQKIKIHLEKG